MLVIILKCLIQSENQRGNEAREKYDDNITREKDVKKS